MHIHPIPGYISTLFLCEYPGGRSLLLDAGSACDVALVKAWCAAHDVAPPSLVVATHAHPDHMGGAAAWQREPGGVVLAAPARAGKWYEGRWGWVQQRVDICLARMVREVAEQGEERLQREAATGERVFLHPVVSAWRYLWRGVAAAVWLPLLPATIWDGAGLVHFPRTLEPDITLDVDLAPSLLRSLALNLTLSLAAAPDPDPERGLGLDTDVEKAVCCIVGQPLDCIAGPVSALGQPRKQPLNGVAVIAGNESAGGTSSVWCAAAAANTTAASASADAATDDAGGRTWVTGWRYLPVPGHTSHMVALFHPDTGTLYAADAVIGKRIKRIAAASTAMSTASSSTAAASTTAASTAAASSASVYTTAASAAAPSAAASAPMSNATAAFTTASTTTTVTTTVASTVTSTVELSLPFPIEFPTMQEATLRALATLPLRRLLLAHGGAHSVSRSVSYTVDDGHADTVNTVDTVDDVGNVGINIVGSTGSYRQAMVRLANTMVRREGAREGSARDWKWRIIRAVTPLPTREIRRVLRRLAV